MPINGSEALVLLVIALLVVGPERLPVYAQQLARLVRELKKMATGAQERARTELGEEFAEFDFAAFDPRQYDPRRIVREALMDDGPAHTSATSTGAAGTLRTHGATGGPGAGARGAAAGAAGATAAGAAGPGGAAGADGRAPYDDEAT